MNDPGAQKTVDYHGVVLLQQEVEALILLEHHTGTNIPKIEHLTWDSFGYITNGAMIIGLGLYKCQLTSLPDVLGNLTNLQYLYLTKNSITSIPKTLGNLIKLQELHLDGNRLDVLPEIIGNLSKLESLKLNNNHLISLPEDLGKLSN